MKTIAKTEINAGLEYMVMVNTEKWEVVGEIVMNEDREVMEIIEQVFGFTPHTHLLRPTYEVYRDDTKCVIVSKLGDKNVGK